MKKRERVKRELLRERNHRCEGILFDQMILKEYHKCGEGLHMNEVFFTRSDFQKLTEKEKEYFWDKINCSIVCGVFHSRWGESRKFREYYYKIQCLRFGKHVVDAWIENAPLKIRWW